MIDFSSLRIQCGRCGHDGRHVRTVAGGDDPRRDRHAGHDHQLRHRRPADPRAQLLEKFLPHDGKYKDVNYDIQWKNFTSGAPLTNEMVAGKLDFGAMADFPGSLNGAAFQKAGSKSLFISVLSGSTQGLRQRHRRAEELARAIAGGTEGQDDLRAVRLHRARHAAARRRRPRAGSRERRQHHHAGAGSRRPRPAGKQGRGACRLRPVRRTVPVARLRAQDLRRLASQCARRCTAASSTRSMRRNIRRSSSPICARRSRRTA